MVKHGAISRTHVYDMLRSKDAHVRRAAFTLLEASNPTLRRDSGLFIEIVQFIWHANPSYEVYQEFSRRHFVRRYKVHELILARLKREKRGQQMANTAQRVERMRQPARGFFKRWFWQATTQ
jgi:hypothetical protein